MRCPGAAASRPMCGDRIGWKMMDEGEGHDNLSPSLPSPSLPSLKDISVDAIRGGSGRFCG